MKTVTENKAVVPSDIIHSLLFFGNADRLSQLSSDCYKEEIRRLFLVLTTGTDTQAQSAWVTVSQRISAQLSNYNNPSPKLLNVWFDELQTIINNDFKHVKFYTVPRIKLFDIGIRLRLDKVVTDTEIAYANLLGSYPSYKVDSYLCLLPILSPAQANRILRIFRNVPERLGTEQVRTAWSILTHGLSNTDIARTLDDLNEHSIGFIQHDFAFRNERYCAFKRSNVFNQMLSALISQNANAFESCHMRQLETLLNTPHYFVLKDTYAAIDLLIQHRPDLLDQHQLMADVAAIETSAIISGIVSKILPFLYLGMLIPNNPSLLSEHYKNLLLDTGNYISYRSCDHGYKSQWLTLQLLAKKCPSIFDEDILKRMIKHIYACPYNFEAVIYPAQDTFKALLHSCEHLFTPQIIQEIVQSNGSINFILPIIIYEKPHLIHPDHMDSLIDKMKKNSETYFISVPSKDLNATDDNYNVCNVLMSIASCNQPLVMKHHLEIIISRITFTPITQHNILIFFLALSEKKYGPFDEETITFFVNELIEKCYSNNERLAYATLRSIYSNYPDTFLPSIQTKVNEWVKTLSSSLGLTDLIFESPTIKNNDVYMPQKINHILHNDALISDANANPYTDQYSRGYFTYVGYTIRFDLNKHLIAMDAVNSAFVNDYLAQDTDVYPNPELLFALVEKKLDLFDDVAIKTLIEKMALRPNDYLHVFEKLLEKKPQCLSLALKPMVSFDKKYMAAPNEDVYTASINGLN